MKTLYLVRHAKSSWDDPLQRDFDRPLNKRGKRDAPLMGNILHQTGVRLDEMLTSPAKRALSTAKRIAEAIGYPKDEIRTDAQIYHATSDTLLHVLQDSSGAVTRMLIGHNPGLTEFANQLVTGNIDNIPTCGIVRIDFAVVTWPEIAYGNGTLVFFDYPKKHRLEE